MPSWSSRCTTTTSPGGANGFSPISASDSHGKPYSRSNLRHLAHGGPISHARHDRLPLGGFRPFVPLLIPAFGVLPPIERRKVLRDLRYFAKFIRYAPCSSGRLMA